MEVWIKAHETPLAAWLTVAILLATLIWSVLVEIPKLRKKLKFLTIEVRAIANPNNPWTNVRVVASNHCRRSLHMRGAYALTFDNLKSRDEFFQSEHIIDEGSEFRFSTDYTGIALEASQIKKIVVFDSVRKRYTGYVYKGKFRNKLVAKALILRDKWFK